MKNKILPSILMCCGAFFAQAQNAFTEMDGNNTAVQLSTGGVFFNDVVNSSSGFEYPAGSSQYLIFATSFWFGGTDVNNQLKFAGQMYAGGEDLYTGPLTTTGAAEITPSVQMAYDVMWTVSKAEIDDHIQNYNTSGYVMPFGIAQWPAHGDAAQDQDFYLAPFVDVNSNDIYDPENGDYPLIRGDVATYLIMNDKADLHFNSGGDIIGMEAHFMFYQYETQDDLNNTTFVNIKLINRGTQTLYDFSVGAFLDADIGDPNDDFFGSDSTLNMMYIYNGDSLDNIYDAQAPAIGMVSLNHDLYTAGSYSNFSGPAGLPLTASEYYLNLQGYHRDGSPRTLGGYGHGGTVANKFQFHGDPNTVGEWSEVDEGNLPTDKRAMLSTTPFVLVPNAEICYDFAFVVGDGGNHLENVAHLKSAVNFVQDFYDNQTYTCENYEDVLSVTPNQLSELLMYPNPSHDQFTIEATGDFELRVLNLLGQEIVDLGTYSGKVSIQHEFNPGMYFIEVSQNGVRELLKLQVE